MDKWEATMKKIMAMPAEERMKRIELSKSMCICKNCPSYRGTGETELLFCSTGQSKIIGKEMGCSCGLCSVVTHMGLTRLYYCTRGTEAEQRGAKM